MQKLLPLKYTLAFSLYIVAYLAFTLPGYWTYALVIYGYGIIPLFHITTNGQIKFQLNYLRQKVRKKEVLRDYQLKLESNFMMDFGELIYPSDIYHKVGELFTIKIEVDKFVQTIQGIAHRLRQ